MDFMSSAFAPVKFVPLSDLISVGFPLLLMNLCSALINELLSSEYEISMCMARTTRHVKMHPYLLTVLRPRVTMNGPK